ncbi:PKD domain-containing protein [Cupriavidus pinatubonensis]|uniref:PKD domain-containing protein n=1 Tax=Cupriavidus pinatubonensis TaxID=248026 RepID=A0ABM8Y4D2_9BURK|nr:PKD domain-containing protein [Cupriavidus pinatubonensis]CAG9187627.1 hypothetical protein LMG23994_07072 [Cupriavidus pinatubonensis]
MKIKELSRRLPASGVSCLLGLAVCACGGGDATPTTANEVATMKAVAAVSLPTTYSIVNLATSGWASPNGINSTGQVAFRDFISPEHAKFYDGTTVQDLGTLGGLASMSQVVNNSGQVAGSFVTQLDAYHAFLWSQASGMLDIDTFASRFSFPTGLSNTGQVVGQGVSNAFSWTQAGGMIDLGTLGGGTYSIAYAVNDLGQVVGASTNASGDYRAFKWTTAGGMVDLGTLGGPWAFAIGVNNSGLVAGYSSTANLPHAFAWTQQGGMIDLGATGQAFATAVGDGGHIVGYHYPPTGPYLRGFVWTSATGLTEVGTGNVAVMRAVNKNGHVAGSDYDSNGTPHATVWTQQDGLIDLNTRIPGAPPGLVLYEGTAISDNGSIVATSNVGLLLLKPGVVSNAAPVVGPIAGNDPVAIGSPVTVSVNFSDSDSSDTHTATWAWDDGSAAMAGAVSESNGAGSVTGSHTYGAAGVYTVSMTVSDNTGRSSTVSRNVVVYDPTAGFVTGGGWIMSPAGAYKNDATLAGRANFAFVSKYKKGATTPTGNTEFQFQAAKLNFHSENYDWLVVAGARAQYKGSGTINGTGDYSFLLTAVDGNLVAKGTPDRFRIKIWHYDADAKADVVDYDNQLSSSSDGTVNEGTVIGGGSIVVQKN